MSNHRHRGHRAARRADRRRRRAWAVGAAIGGVLVLALGGLAVATVLAGEGDAEVSAPAARRAPTTTTPATATAVTASPEGGCRSGLTPAAPLRLWIAGDSIAYSVGTGLGKRAANTGVVAPVYESRVSSGLASPGFFDWPKRVTEELPRLDPEVVVFVMGTNDWALPQATPLDASGQPAWKAAYTTRVQAIVDALTADGRTLYWVGPPVMRDPAQEAGGRQIGSVIRAVVEGDPDAEFVDAHDLLDGDDGSYTASVEVDGKKVQVRAGDGVHLTPDGAAYLGDAVFARLDARCRIKAQAVADAKQPVVETKGSTSVAPGSTATAPPVATSPSTSAPAGADAPAGTAGPTGSTTPTAPSTPGATGPPTTVPVPTTAASPPTTTDTAPSTPPST